MSQRRDLRDTRHEVKMKNDILFLFFVFFVYFNPVIFHRVYSTELLNFAKEINKIGEISEKDNHSGVK